MTGTLNDAATDPQQTIAELQRKLAERTAERDELLQQRTATADVLKVISRSAVRPAAVFETLARSAVELSSARQRRHLPQGRRRPALPRGLNPDLNAEWLRFMEENPQQSWAVTRDWPRHRCTKTVCTPDVEADPEIRMPAYLAGVRAVLAVPLFGMAGVEGVIALSRQEPGPFTERQIALLKTFADQAVIAIQNARLFNETREALERQTATADILQGDCLFADDVQPVFEAIAD